MPHHCGKVCAVPAAPKIAYQRITASKKMEMAKECGRTHEVEDEHDDLGSSVHSGGDDVAVALVSIELWKVGQEKVHTCTS